MPTTGAFVKTWAWLMALALASLLLSFVRLGAWSTALALAIAVAKAVLIARVFMHLAHQPSISRWAFGFGIALALLLLIMIAVDVITRDPVSPRPPLTQSATPTPVAPGL